jgi:hypothetical protein
VLFLHSEPSENFDHPTPRPGKRVQSWAAAAMLLMLLMLANAAVASVAAPKKWFLNVAADPPYNQSELPSVILPRQPLPACCCSAAAAAAGWLLLPRVPVSHRSNRGRRE